MKDSFGISLPGVMGKMYPNGEFVIWKPRCTQDNPLDGMPKVPGVIDYIGAIVDAEMPEGDYAVESVSHMGLSIDPILNLPDTGDFRARAVKGLAGITSYGRRMIRNGCFLLERRYCKEQLSFLTMTLPSFSIEDGRVVQGSWSQVMQSFKNSFAKQAKKQGLPLDYVYCIEIQPLRSRSAGWPVLHVHMVFVGRNSKHGAWRIKTWEIDAMWKKALEGALGRTVEVKSACNVQEVKKSAEGYMSKYLSKGAPRLNEWREAGLEDFFPSHWWGMSTHLRAFVRGQTYYGEAVGLELEAIAGRDDMTVYSRTITVEFAGASITVGRYGRLTEAAHALLKSVLNGKDELPF